LLVFRCDDLGDAYQAVLREVEESGDEVRPRGMEVREVRPLVIELTDPSRSMVRRPGVNRALIWLEIAFILAGEYDHALLARIAPSAAELMTPHGAYGPRAARQLEAVVDELTDDPDSRRAVVLISRETDLEAARSVEREQPCTLSWQFLLRGGRLEMVASMRSWDLVWGLSGDVPCFTVVQRALAACLGAEAGTYYHVAGSGHVYARHYGLWRDVRPGAGDAVPLPVPDLGGLATPRERWAAVVASAREALRALSAGDPSRAPEEWAAAARAWGRRTGA